MHILQTSSSNLSSRKLLDVHQEIECNEIILLCTMFKNIYTRFWQKKYLCPSPPHAVKMKIKNKQVYPPRNTGIKVFKYWVPSPSITLIPSGYNSHQLHTCH